MRFITRNSLVFGGGNFDLADRKRPQSHLTIPVESLKSPVHLWMEKPKAPGPGGMKREQNDCGKFCER